MEKANIDRSAIETTHYRRLTGFPRLIVILFATLGIAFSILFLFNVSFKNFVIPTIQYLYFLLALFLPLTFLCLAPNKTVSDRIQWFDWVFATLTFGIFIYFGLHYMNIMMGSWETILPTLPFIMGCIVVPLVIEASRRSAGLAFAIIVVVIMVYPLFAGSLPGMLKGQSYGIVRLISYYVAGPASIIGLPMQTLGTMFIGFMVFASALQYSGGGRFFTDLAFGLMGGAKGGAAKVSIFGSALFGTISGSAVSNVLTIGSFTIPAMKKSGYEAHFAGAVEACASTGGIIMPPIMGAVAFLMAQMLGIPYYRVCLIAAVPSVLYYFCLFVQVNAHAEKIGLQGLPKDSLPSVKKTLSWGWVYIFSFAALVYLLFVLRIESQAPYMAIIPLLACAMIYKQTRLTGQTLLQLLYSSGQALSEIVGMLAAVGLIIGSLFLSGLAQALPSELFNLARGNLLLLVLFGAVASYILGMGLTVSAIYILLAVLLAPTLIKGGIWEPGAHFFILYTGVLSAITPPVAMASLAAASLAGAPFMKVGLQACRLGVMLFILPLFFVFNPPLLLSGTPMEIIQALSFALVGTYVAASAVEGYERYVTGIGTLKPGPRLLVLLAGLVMLLPDIRAQIAGLVLFSLVAVIGRVFIKSKKQQPAQG